MKKPNNQFIEKILALIFGVLGVIFIIVAVLLASHSGRIARTYIKTTAEITGFDITRSNTDSRYRRRTAVKYEVEGQSLEQLLNEYSSSMYEGKIIPVLVNPEDYYDVRTSTLLYLPAIIFGVVAIPFLVVSIILIVVMVSRNKRFSRIYEEGKRITAEVTGGRINRNYSVNNRHPWRLECRYEDTFTGEEHVFKSGNVWFDPNQYIGRPISVYILDGNYSNYYIDVDSLDL